jgi:hypothetical protein
MANFRMERLFIRVNGFIDGFDPNEGIDVAEFAFLCVRDHGTYERNPLSGFVSAPVDRPRWFRASEGLDAVRGFISELEAQLKGCDEKRRAGIERDIQTLRTVEDRLDRIDLKDLKFHFLAKDLD